VGRPDDESVIRGLEDLARRWEGPLVRIAYRITGSLADAEDIRQTVFLALLERPGTIRRPEALRAWTLRAAANASINAVRRRMREARHAGLLARRREAGPAEDAIGREDLGRRIAAALAALPPEERAAAALRFEEDLTYGEIAEALDVPLTTARSWVERAKERLRRILREFRPGVLAFHLDGVGAIFIVNLTFPLDDAPPPGDEA